MIMWGVFFKVLMSIGGNNAPILTEGNTPTGIVVSPTLGHRCVNFYDFWRRI